MTELLDLSLEDRAFQTWSMGFLSLDTNARAEYEAYRKKELGLDDQPHRMKYKPLVR